MTQEEAEAVAYQVLVVSMPATWMERGGRMTPKAIYLRKKIAYAIRAAEAQTRQRCEEAVTAICARPMLPHDETIRAHVALNAVAAIRALE